MPIHIPLIPAQAGIQKGCPVIAAQAAGSPLSRGRADGGKREWNL